MPTDQRIEKYLARRPLASPWRLSPLNDSIFRGAVVIPALAENANLSTTLESLAVNDAELLKQFLVVVVVNHREDADQLDKDDNLATLAMLPDLAIQLPMNLAWVDAATPGLELPRRDGGVGMARKIGFDLVLPFLDWQYSQPILVALDADTLVETNYLDAIRNHFSGSGSGGAVIPFCHRNADTSEGQEIIDLYELFLRSYVLGLAFAGSPYAFHTVGSAMACTADAYIRSGGMNSRRAGEDFYFLQQLKKVAGIEQVTGTLVHPSPRSSHRVPFGTGRSVSNAMGGDTKAIEFYHPECYRVLKKWLRLATASFGITAEQVREDAERISPLLVEYLNGEQFVASWQGISQVKKARDPFVVAFHEWFDALRSMKLIHYLSDKAFPRASAEETMVELLKMARLEPVTGVRGQLELLRKIQNSG